MDLEIEILASDKLKAVYNVYQKLKRLFDPLSKFLETLIYVTESPLPAITLIIGMDLYTCRL